MKPILLNGDDLTIEQLGALAELPYPREGEVRAIVPEEARVRVRKSRALVESLDARDEPFYGINTGFGSLCQVRIAPADLNRLQENLIVSHAVGVGVAVPAAVVRLMLAIKINSLVKGLSGVRESLIDYLLLFLNQDILPHIPIQGSVGSSGDLAPLAHMSLALMGMGRVAFRGLHMDACDALQHHDLPPLALQSKEGLALINGTQFMSGYGALVLHRMKRLAGTADVATAVSLEALRGSLRPFREEIHRVRPHPGQIASAKNVRQLMRNSEILESHANCSKVQDPYSLRCVPQVHGACRDAMNYARQVVSIEVNSATDNPLIFEDGTVLSGGNFHGEPLALAMDFAAMGLAEFASISERRTYLLLEGEDDLPKLLMKDTGLNSGFMLPQYTSAALVSENKGLCHPACVDSIPTSLGQEDHVSMGSISARKSLTVLENSETVLAIELMCASQGLDFRLPLKPGEGVAAAHARIRKDITHAEQDRLFAFDIEKSIHLVRTGAVLRAAEEVVGELE